MQAPAEQQGRTSRVFWDSRSQLPMLIVDSDQHVAWRVTKLNSGAVPPEVFRVDASDFVVNDANRDLERD